MSDFDTFLAIMGALSFGALTYALAIRIDLGRGKKVTLAPPAAMLTLVVLVFVIMHAGIGWS